MPYMTGRSPSARPVLPSQLASQPANPLDNVIHSTIGGMGTILQRNDGTWYDTSTGKYLGNGSTPQGATQDNQGMWQSTPAPVNETMAYSPIGMQQPAPAPVNETMAYSPIGMQQPAPAPVPPPTGQMPRSYNRMTPRHAPAPQPTSGPGVSPYDQYNTLPGGRDYSSLEPGRPFLRLPAGPGPESGSRLPGDPAPPQSGGMMNLAPQMPPAPAPAPEFMMADVRSGAHVMPSPPSDPAERAKWDATNAQNAENQMLSMLPGVTHDMYQEFINSGAGSGMDFGSWLNKSYPNRFGFGFQMNPGGEIGSNPIPGSNIVQRPALPASSFSPLSSQPLGTGSLFTQPIPQLY